MKSNICRECKSCVHHNVSEDCYGEITPCERFVAVDTTEWLQNLRHSHGVFYRNFVLKPEPKLSDLNGFRSIFKHDCCSNEVGYGAFEIPHTEDFKNWLNSSECKRTEKQIQPILISKYPDFLFEGASYEDTLFNGDYFKGLGRHVEAIDCYAHIADVDSLSSKLVLARITSCYRNSGSYSERPKNSKLAIRYFYSQYKKYGIEILSGPACNSIAAAYCDLGFYEEAYLFYYISISTWGITDYTENIFSRIAGWYNSIVYADIPVLQRPMHPRNQRTL